ncbi:sister chromatid cohesion protein PDS5 homolog A-like [Rhincodon typus]|uniref:sister chromatid cohesion protein PDS5 homolog A-like n=1 Tax=Rhincodon typus TaxID=259920 RepID=UPI00202DFF1E|nr:sister chromatid cohesion protein PDS5 homolog A-like [Rhincodon typus]
MAFPQPKPADGKIIIYPPGVKEITDKISNDELVKRLKMVVKTFMDMDQDSEDEKQQYLPLALHLASEFFLRNPNKDVRLLVACCLADIFRIYAPEAPYTSHDKLKDIFMFITRQLKGLEDTKSPQFNRYFYLLENLAWVKSYNICFELEDCNEIFIQLFRTLFSVINNSHNQKVQMHMLDLMSSIIMEGDGVTQDLLDSILINLIPAHKNMNKQAYDLAKVLLKRTAQTIEPCIASFFNQVLVLGKSSVSDLSEHVFDLIMELFAIDPHLLLSVMPQLEFKLKSNDGEERLAVVRLLAKLFGAKDSELATQNRPLWQCFLGRFNDIHVPVRLECVKFASHCLMNHPDLAKDLTEYLKVRSHDPEEAIRHDVIVTIITAGKKDLSLVNDQLLGFVRERTLDKRWRVRKEAMMGLAQLYKKYCLHPKPATVLGAVNKPLSAAGRRPQDRTPGLEMGSNISGNSEPSSPPPNRGREQNSEVPETEISENEENPVILLTVVPAKTEKKDEPVRNKEMSSEQSLPPQTSTERGKKRTAPAGSENIQQIPEERKSEESTAPVPPKARRGRPPKAVSESNTAKNSDPNKAAGRGRKRVAASQEGPAEPETTNVKVPKQQETNVKRASAQRQMDLQRIQVLDSDGYSVMDLESTPESSAEELDLFKSCESSQNEVDNTKLAERGFLKVRRKSMPKGRRQRL